MQWTKVDKKFSSHYLCKINDCELSVHTYSNNTPSIGWWYILSYDDGNLYSSILKGETYDTKELAMNEAINKYSMGV